MMWRLENRRAASVDRQQCGNDHAINFLHTALKLRTPESLLEGQTLSWGILIGPGVANRYITSKCTGASPGNLLVKLQLSTGIVAKDPRVLTLWQCSVKVYQIDISFSVFLYDIEPMHKFMNPNL